MTIKTVTLEQPGRFKITDTAEPDAPGSGEVSGARVDRRASAGPICTRLKARSRSLLIRGFWGMSWRWR